MSDKKRPFTGPDSPVDEKRLKVENSQESLNNEAEFKRRKIEEWKAKMGLQSTASGIDFDAIKRKVAEASQRLKGAKLGIDAHVSPAPAPSNEVSKVEEPIKEEVKQQQAKLEIIKPPIEKDNPYFDKTIGVPVKLRKKPQFKFVAHGKYIQKAERLRSEARLEALKQKISETIKKTGVDASLDLISEKSIRRDAPPLLEWWDLPLMHGYRTYDELFHEETNQMKEIDFTTPVPMATDSDMNKANRSETTEMLPPITIYIQHPVPIPPVFESPPPPRQVMLTKRERQKLRRQRRMEEQRERQDKIRLGLLPPEQPKVRMANLARVLRNESVIDPTKVDAEVRQQVEARRIQHEKQNLERKLTPEQRKEKILQRRLREESKGIFVVVFKCKDMSHPKIKFKINKNVQQLGLTGLAVMQGETHLVAVEGGARSVRHFKKLMLRRINWKALDQDEQDGEIHPSMNGEDSGDSDEDYDGSNQQHCWVLWEGQPSQRQFQGFRFKRCMTEQQASELFQKSDAQQYWDLAKSWTPSRLL